MSPTTADHKKVLSTSKTALNPVPGIYPFNPERISSTVQVKSCRQRSAIPKPNQTVMPVGCDQKQHICHDAGPITSGRGDINKKIKIHIITTGLETPSNMG